MKELTKLEKMYSAYQALNIAKKKLEEIVDNNSKDLLIRSNIIKLNASMLYLNKRIQTLVKLKTK